MSFGETESSMSLPSEPGPFQPRAEGVEFPIWSYLSCYPARFMASPQVGGAAKSAEPGQRATRIFASAVRAAVLRPRSAPGAARDYAAATGSIKLGSLFLTLPTRALTGQQII
jgi:hypothetical protein